MSSNEQVNVRRRIVTSNSIGPDATLLGDERGLESLGRENLERRILYARYEQLLKKIRTETRRVGSDRVMVALQDRDASRVQSELARQATDVRPLHSGGLEAKFGTGLRGGDWFGWLKSTLNWVDRENAHPILRASETVPAKFPDVARVAMAGDWGTGLYGAPEIAKQIRRLGKFQLLLHLGDVYYAGTKEEVQERMLDLWPRDAGEMTRVLNSNHEMYSGGYGYFDLELPAFGQQSSYFAFQNNHWLLMFLDTAYVDHDIDADQVGWLNAVIEKGDRRKIVMFSHQQLFSRLDCQGPKLKKALLHLLESRMITAWYWGHEHQCVLYDPHPDYKLVARCLGNGGIPEPRKDIVTQSETERIVDSLSWKRLAGTENSPSCLVLDGPNEFVEGEEHKFGPHGFMTLDFDGPVLKERVISANGAELFVNEVK